jgi:hypothetical protein
LLGSYKTPRFTYGSVVTCQVRVHVVITCLTSARIPWLIANGAEAAAGR